jgi:hypothetical protein
LSGWRWAAACIITFALAVAAVAPTTRDFGLTWDEPTYRKSQIPARRWCAEFVHARSWADLQSLCESTRLLSAWPYTQLETNAHPPLAGELNLVTLELFGGALGDITARRLASVLEFCATITIVFGFLARRYGAWVGGIAATALMLMPRVYGQAHLIDTDTPGLLLWTGAAFSFWNALHAPTGRRWRILLGILVGMAFLNKISAILVLVPLGAWGVGCAVVDIVNGRARTGAIATLIDGCVTTAAMLLPLGLAGSEVMRLASLLPPPQLTNLLANGPESYLPGAILVAPLLIWGIRELVRRQFPSHPIWGLERPKLETLWAILAFAPAVAWLGNPAWWRATIPRLAHYAAIVLGRHSAVGENRIIYLGDLYDYSLPWHNAWALIGVTVPAGILAAAAVGMLVALGDVRRDPLKLYILSLLVTLPIVRMFPTPAHDGVRLFLPTFVSVAILASWGVVALADNFAQRLGMASVWPRLALSGIVLGSACGQLVRVHPFELSYYNELIGGPRGAWRRGFELAYWYDAFNRETLADLNRRLPPGASLISASEYSTPPTFPALQALGLLRPDIDLEAKGGEFQYRCLLTHDSKSTAFSRIIFALKPWYARRPTQLGGARVVTIADPVAVSRAWALALLTDEPPVRRAEPARAPEWVHAHCSWLARLWGDGLKRIPRPTVHEPSFAWANRDPDGLRAAARGIVEGKPTSGDPGTRRLLALLTRADAPGLHRDLSGTLLRARPEALVEAVEILIRRGDDLRRVLLRVPYTELGPPFSESPEGNYLDAELAIPRASG